MNEDSKNLFHDPFSSIDLSDNVTDCVTDYLANTSSQEVRKESILATLAENLPGYTFDVTMHDNKELTFTVKVTPQDASASFEIKF
jgi:hypothetical protein